MLRRLLPAVLTALTASPVLYQPALAQPVLTAPPKAAPQVQAQPLTTVAPRIVEVRVEPGAMVSSPAVKREVKVTIKLVNVPDLGDPIFTVPRPDSTTPDLQRAFQLMKPVLDGRCAFYTHARLAGPPPVNGAVTIEAHGDFRQGVFDDSLAAKDRPAPPDGFAGPCPLYLVLSLHRPKAGTISGEHSYFLVRGPDVTLTPLSRRTVNDTWSLRRQFDFAMISQRGDCSGTSSTPAASYPVGPHERGGDLALQVRSGPVGTACLAVAPAHALPAGVVMTAWDWDAAFDGDKCGFGQDDRPAGVSADTAASPGSLLDGFTGSTLTSFVNCCDGVTAAQTRFGVSGPAIPAGRPATNALYLRMNCRETAVNDHGVRAVLKSATFEGPAGFVIP